MEQLVNFVIRPPRADYSPMHDLLEQEFTLKRHRYQRKDLEIINDRGHVLQCSHYMPLPMPEDRPLPCVIYCHGNSGCRADASEAAIILLPSYITVFTLDFSGSGLSEGDHVTLGWNEKDDLKAVVNFLRADEHISCIGLWGRSMGAVTSLMYGAEDPSIAGMVLDSPFANLVDLMMELVDVYKIRLPKFTVKVAVQYMRKVIQKKARFDIMDLDVIQIAAKSFIPALFGHATEDLFIQPHHSDLLYNSYAGDKNIIKFEGDHNSPRPQFYYDSITIFFHNVLHPPDDLIEEHASEYIYEYLDVLENLDENGWHDIMSGAGSTPSSTVLAPHQPDEFSADSTEDAINHSRSRWQMSRTEVPVDDIAHDSDKIVDFLQAEDLSGCEMLPSDSFDLKGKENGCTVEGSSYKSYNINESSSDQQNPDAAAVHTNNEVADRPVDSFAQFPLTTADEERMLMEAITASLRDLEIGHAYQDQTSKDKETHSHQTASESAAQDAPQGLDKEFVQKSSPSEVNTLLLRDGSPTQHGSPKKVNDTTEESNADVFTPRSPSVGTSHPWSIKFSQSGQ